MPATTSRMKRTGDRESLPLGLALLEGYITHLPRLFRERTTFVGLLPESVERNGMPDIPCSHERLVRVDLDELGMSRFSSPRRSRLVWQDRLAPTAEEKTANHSLAFADSSQLLRLDTRIIKGALRIRLRQKPAI